MKKPLHLWVWRLFLGRDIGSGILLILGFQRNPNADGSGEFSRGRFAHVDTFCRDHLAVGEGEAGPWFGHAVEAHLLERLTGDGVHNRCSNSHGRRLAGRMGDCPSLMRNLFDLFR